MPKVTNELIHEVLKDVQSRLGVMDIDIKDLKDGQLSIRKDIHDVRGDLLRQEANWARFETRLDRLETAAGIEGDLDS